MKEANATPRLFSAPLRLCASCLLLVLLGTTSPATAPPARPIYKNPLDVTVDTQGETARVVLTGPRTVAVVDLKSGRVVKEEPWPADKVMPQPSDVSVHLPRDVDNADQLAKDMVRYHPNNARGVWVDLALRSNMVVYQRPRHNLPATQLAQGWVFTNGLGLSSADAIPTGWVVQTRAIVLDGINQGCADPSDVVCSATVDRAFVSSAGVDALLVLDVDKMKHHPAYMRDKNTLFEILSASQHYILARLPTQSNPRRLGLSGDGKTLLVSNYLSDSLTVIDTAQLKVVKHISLNGPKPDTARRGEILFNSAKLTQFGQFTCASCHPNGGADGLNWDLPRDGLGNPKNTKSLLGVKDTAPYGWLGTSPTLADRVRGTLRTLHRYEPSEEEVSDLVAYLETLEAPAPPKPQVAEEEKVDRGKLLFEGKAGCVTCHAAPTFQDGKSHNVGTGTIEGEDRLDTPSLRGVRLTAPYLHDGRAATLEEVFTKHNTKKQHGEADKLTAEKLADLIAYLKSL